ncbi:MAG: UDP-galactopyranose mutase [Clostridia bacterium]|nr:UDP-galactopyranose mutase [Clostridia bacterium]
MKKVIVVGAGLSGATVARLYAEDGADVLVMDRRATLGGNVHDYVDKNGITVQTYGPHIFHTNKRQVFDFLSRFTEWEKYEHKVLANLNGQLVPVPFNLTGLYQLFPKEKAKRINDLLVAQVGEGVKVPILSLKSHENAEIREFAQFVYDNIFYKYTKKQWGMPPEALGEQVMNRVPVYLSYEDRYFTDEFQYMPKNGFTALVEKMLCHPNITTKLCTDASKAIALKDGKIYLDGRAFDGTVIYTGRIDELFSYRFGALPYRSLKFKFITKNLTSYQPSAVVNYTTDKRFTRISEFTKFTCSPKNKTVIVKEFSRACGKKSEPYYPIPIEQNLAQYAKYKILANGYANLKLLGRLANYKYVNMDVAVEDAIALHDNNPLIVE